MKDHAHYDVDSGVLELSTRYKTIKPRQTILPVQKKYKQQDNTDNPNNPRNKSKQSEQ